MKFKVDENLPIEVTELFKQSGYDAMTVLEEDLGGIADADLASICQKELRAFVTLDTDFADIRAYPPGQFYGLIVLRLKRQDKPYILKILSNLVLKLLTEPLERHLWIVEEDRIRIRD